MRDYKWKKVLREHPLFINLDKLKEELESFFDAADFDQGAKIDPDNWFLHILSNHTPNSICIINETAELIKYLRTIENAKVYHFRTNDGLVNYKALQEKLYEVHINYLFYVAGLNPKIGESYLSKSGNIKEIDILLNVGHDTYNVEITKFYDGFKEELLALTTDILSYLHQITIKRELKLHEMFSGYFAFKVRDERVIKKNKPLFGTRIKQLLHGYRGQKEAVILFPAKVTEPDYEFNLEPTFNKHYEESYNDLLKPFRGSIRFRITANLKTNRFLAEAKAECTENVDDANKRLLKKIKEKINQHKNCTYKLLIVIGIEQMFSSHYKSRALPIHKKDVDEKGIHNLIRGKAVVWLVFKEMQPLGVRYEVMTLGSTLYHSEMIEYLTTMNPSVSYTTNPIRPVPVRDNDGRK
jgi:hypothetical protein